MRAAIAIMYLQLMKIKKKISVGGVVLLLSFIRCYYLYEYNRANKIKLSEIGIKKINVSKM